MFDELQPIPACHCEQQDSTSAAIGTTGRLRHPANHAPIQVAEQDRLSGTFRARHPAMMSTTPLGQSGFGRVHTARSVVPSPVAKKTERAAPLNSKVIGVLAAAIAWSAPAAPLQLDSLNGTSTYEGSQSSFACHNKCALNRRNFDGIPIQASAVDFSADGLLQRVILSFNDRDRDAVLAALVRRYGSPQLSLPEGALWSGFDGGARVIVVPGPPSFSGGTLGVTWEWPLNER